MSINRLALLKERAMELNGELLEEGKDPLVVYPEVAVEDAPVVTKSEKSDRFPFITGSELSRHKRRREVAPVIPNREWLEENCARHGIDPDHLEGKTMDYILEKFSKIPEDEYGSYGGQADGVTRDVYSNHFGITSRREARQTSGGHDLGDGC